MKSTFKKSLFLVGIILTFIGVLAFAGCLCAALLVCAPGFPSETAQALIIIAACGLPVSMLGMFLATLD